MKYDPNRNYLYPVLRPYSDDYPTERLSTQLEATVHDDDIDIAMTFVVSEKSIQQQVLSGNARCVAMLYCRDTIHREMLSANEGCFEFKKSVSARVLVNSVELHPSIVAAVGLVSESTDSVHEEYQGVTTNISKWQPLATDQTWHLHIGAGQRSTVSIFNVALDDDLSDGEFDVNVDPTERYLTVRANGRTKALFQRNLRSNEALAASTIYMNALLEALAWLKYKFIHDDHDIHSEGWVTCINNNLKKHGIDLGNEEDPGSHSVFRAAQLLLAKPVGELIRDEHLVENVDYD